jgi:hypothetical protein
MMQSTKNRKDELPDQFTSYEEAGEFWDHHDSTDYLDQMTPVKMDAQLVRRRFEIELDEDVVEPLRKRAAIESLPASEIANKLLRKELTSTP